jgi:hypothetical protein
MVIVLLLWLFAVAPMAAESQPELAEEGVRPGPNPGVVLIAAVVMVVFIVMAVDYRGGVRRAAASHES